jgi:superfamily II DNA or RNA helicase
VNQIEIINNKIAKLILEDEEVFDKIRRLLSFQVEGAAWSEAVRAGRWDGITYLINGKKEFPLGLRARVETLLQEFKVEYSVIDKRRELVIATPLDISANLNKMNIKWYDYQQECINLTQQYQRGILRIATGGGKSLLAAGMTAQLNKPTIVLVIGIQLLDQFYQDFCQVFNEEIGYIGNGITEIKRINIASIWTLAKALDISLKDLLDDDDEFDEEAFDESNKSKIIDCMKNTNVFILDECQIATTTSLRSIYQAINPEYFFGLSGTPFRDDNTSLLSEGLMGPKLIDIPASLLIEQGILVQPFIKFVDCPAQKLKGKYQGIYRDYIVQNEERNILAKDNALELIEKGYRPFCLFKQIKHGDILADMFDDNDIKFGLLSGKDNIDKRNKIIKDFKDKKIDLILASNIFDIGVNVKEVDSLIITSGGKSRYRSLQRVGRAIRSFPGKNQAAIVDFLDNCKYLKDHSEIRYNTYCSEPGFKVFRPKKV